MSKGKIFTAQEVQAIIAGNKTMFREAVKSKPIIKRGDDYLFDDNGKIVSQKDCCPYQVGQKIFVKESWCAFTGETLGTPLGKMRIYSYPPKKGDIITYKADADLTKDFSNYLSSRTMPQWASRLTLLIKEIRVEKLSEISKDDAIAEGMFFTDYGKNCYNQQEAGWSWKKNKSPSECLGSAYWAFANKWNTTHKKPEEKFEANPWVWSIRFEVVK
jgi:hypothetical protein